MKDSLTKLILISGLFVSARASAGAPGVTFDQASGGIGPVTEHLRMSKDTPPPPKAAFVNTSLFGEQFFERSESPKLFSSARKDARLIGSFVFQDGNVVNARMDRADIDMIPGNPASVPAHGLVYDLASMAGTYEIRSPQDGGACVISMDKSGNAKAYSSRDAMRSGKSDVGLLINRVSERVLVLSCAMARQSGPSLHMLAGEGGSGPPALGCQCRWVYTVCQPPAVGPCREYVCTCWNGP